MNLPLFLVGFCLFQRNRNKRDIESGDTNGIVQNVDAPQQSPSHRRRRDIVWSDANRDSGSAVADASNTSNDKVERNKHKPNGSASQSSAGSPMPSLRPSIFDRVWNRIVSFKDFIFQNDCDDNADITHERQHRLLPILSGIIIPFSILLEIPGLTGHWYIITEDNKIVVSRKNSPLLDAGLAFSMACALMANIAIILRFLEKKVRTATLVAIVALSTHDVINIIAVTIFGVMHRFNDGFTYGQSFWFTLCSTIASLITNITLVIDYVYTPDFAHASSGLTRKQRSLVIVVMLLLCWIALGGLANSLIMGLNFIDGLYFTVVTIETVGFGDIVPKTPGARAFCALHATLGILNLALAVGICNDTVIESFEAMYRKHLYAFDERRKASRERRRERRLRRRAEKLAMERQLVHAGLPVYAYMVENIKRARVRVPVVKKKRRLNVDALTVHQKEAAMREASEILRKEVEIVERKRRGTFPSQLSFDVSIAEGLKKEFMVKLTVVITLFLTFWLIGAAVFHATEGWVFGSAMWFCFETFTTIGYGDQTPVTPAGRSVFIVWALLGVGTMTILISVLSEAYSSRYKKVIQAHTARARAEAVESLAQSIHRMDDEEEGHEKRGREQSHVKRGHTHTHGHGDGHKYGVYRLGRRHASCPSMARARAQWSNVTSDASEDEDGVSALSPACRGLRIRDGELDPDWHGSQRATLGEEKRLDSVDFATTTRTAPLPS